MDRSETIVTDPNTGGQKAAKLARFDLLPWDGIWALAEHYGRGAQKYEDRNWERGYKWSLGVSAAMRHVSLWLMGEQRDTETGTHHLICAVWHMLALWVFDTRGLGTDDRGACLAGSDDDWACKMPSGYCACGEPIVDASGCQNCGGSDN